MADDRVAKAGLTVRIVIGERDEGALSLSQRAGQFTLLIGGQRSIRFSSGPGRVHRIRSCRVQRGWNGSAT
ncbi:MULTISPECIES: hypothetical protein [unclassified Tardiphaga]|uniref:hypothetical protein n=1 Tax=unclassified Tardiphaga TaxID=2631404 RepID=UPI001FEE850B|nr:MULTISPECIES: hypothetical protein [unclassified Tardiphaga]